MTPSTTVGALTTSAMRWLGRSVTDALAACVFVAIVVLVLARVGGVQVRAVSTGSMSPTLPVGSLAIVDDVRATDVFVGDIVMFSDNQDRLLLHRVIEIIDHEDLQLLRTKGDNNQVPDTGLVTPDHLIGRLRGSVPKLGGIATDAYGPKGILLIVLAQLPFAARAARRPKSQPARVVAPRPDTPPSAPTPHMPRPRVPRAIDLGPSWLTEPATCNRGIRTRNAREKCQRSHLSPIWVDRLWTT